MEKDRSNPRVFIPYNLKSKGNIPYHFLIEVSLSLVQNMAMTKYLIYNTMINWHVGQYASQILLQMLVKPLVDHPRLE